MVRMLAHDNGLTTIEEARRQYEKMNTYGSLYARVILKCWINHSESRNRNNNPPFTYENYQHHMRIVDCVEQIKLNMIDVEDLGGKEQVITMLTSGFAR
jgi:hypothetical protein